MAVKTKDTKPASQTPLMKQYFAIKAKYPDALLLFRVGDFYETFGEDAKKAASILDIVLTSRNNGSSRLELAGFPHHSLDTYLPKLVRAGLRVAICEQLEEPSKAKKIVKRGVTEIVTPGVAYNSQVLESKENNFLASVVLSKKEAGVAFIDVSTGDFLVTQGNIEQIDKLLQSFKPSEVIIERNQKRTFSEKFGEKFHLHTLEDWAFSDDFTYEKLITHFQTQSLKGYGIEELKLGIKCAGAVLHYVEENQGKKPAHITQISRIDNDEYVWLDKFTVRNLELIYSSNENATTLIDVIDHTLSPMGSRLLKKWVALPLKNPKRIQQRLDVVDFFIQNPASYELVRNALANVGDLERLITRAGVQKITPREVLQLRKGLEAIIPIKKHLKQIDNERIKAYAEILNPCETLIEKIQNTLREDAPAVATKGGVIKKGVSAELDELQTVLYSGKDLLQQIKDRESERTGIPSLKIGFNNVFGYYIEVTHAHKNKVPEEWHRKQTLTNAERYITPELKELENKILTAEEKILQLEIDLYNDLMYFIADFTMPIQQNAKVLAELDCLLGFASVSLQNTYVKPIIEDSKTLDIIGGRHPVIEKQLPPGEAYIPNDVYLDDKKQQIIIITGPNMAGKSALLRQTALIVLMAQIGCFVPATQAKIGVVDKIFTRVGASDNLSMGESTFMVEMNETASILNNLSDRSLILLDEIGRGTSTYDGISIAWAIAEFLHEHKFRPKTLFATHYHELNDMAEIFPRIKNYNVAIKEIDGKILFLRKLVPGGSEHSFGIHVAEIAGIPKKVIKRANEILKDLEEKSSRETQSPQSKVKQEKLENLQLSFFQLDDPVLSQIKQQLEDLDINSLTPVEALFKLNEIKKLIGR
ncbi:MAG: DNA mismatch repair protein MutS [Bacteroidetes bacterium]|nr:MAG: DNA mismatch repair protein MutS [Bacteroidota bacterium]